MLILALHACVRWTQWLRTTSFAIAPILLALRCCVSKPNGNRAKRIFFCFHLTCPQAIASACHLIKLPKILVGYRKLNLWLKWFFQSCSSQVEAILRFCELYEEKTGIANKIVWNRFFRLEILTSDGIMVVLSILDREQLAKTKVICETSKSLLSPWDRLWTGKDSLNSTHT